VDHNSALKAECDVQSRTIYLENGSTIKAISSDYAGAAGSNHGWVSVDELWAVSSAAGRRLWDELTPVPTRKNSVRFVSTYAGFTNESELLEELYQKAVVEGERIHDELPIYVNRPARIFAYWDHERRMPWQLGAEGEQYYEAQRRTLRPATFARLHQRVDVFRIEIH
jgi:phage terminase large subunit-like protein